MNLNIRLALGAGCRRQMIFKLTGIGLEKKMRSRICLSIVAPVFLAIAMAPPVAAQVTDLFNNTNTQAVTNGPRKSSRFVLKAPARIWQLITYHWNLGRGAQPGAIGLRLVNGPTYGPFNAFGTSSGPARNVNWIANVDIALPAGEYEIFDTDPVTWSHNAGSGFQGFAVVRGSLAISSPQDRGSNDADAPTMLIPASAMPRVAPQLAGQNFSDEIGGSDTVDYLLLNVTGPNGTLQPRSLNFTLNGYSGYVQLHILTFEQIRPQVGNPVAARTVVAAAPMTSNNSRSVTLSLSSGMYLIRVASAGGAITYQLTITTPLN